MFFSRYLQKFNNESAIIEHYIQIRYKGKPRCHHCGSTKTTHRKDKPKMFQCNSCNKSFSIFKGTIFEKTTTDLRKWFYAIHLLINSKKGISGYQLQREIDVTYKTAWRMLHKIRNAMVMRASSDLFHAFIEVDETYIGGKPRKKSKNNKRGRGTSKQPVIGIVDRENKTVYAKVAHPNKEGKKLSGKQLLDVIKEACKCKNTTIYTDEFIPYNILKSKKATDANYTHLVVDHSKMFVDGDIHTNNIESFWGTLKRGIYGIHHHVSVDYLQNYINEFCFRYNNRDGQIFFVPEIFDRILENSINY